MDPRITPELVKEGINFFETVIRFVSAIVRKMLKEEMDVVLILRNPDHSGLCILSDLKNSGSSQDLKDLVTAAMKKLDNPDEAIHNLDDDKVKH